MANHFADIITAAQKAQAQFSVIHGRQSDNEEVVRELAADLMNALAGIVYDAGGSDYMDGWAEKLVNDIDLSFQSAAEPVNQVFRRRFGLVRGASL